MSRLLFLPALFFILFSGCKKFDPKIEVPSYIEISDYTVITDSVTQGTSNQKFTDVLVTSSTRNYGYFPIPGKIPIPLEGETFLNIRPAILVNGVKFLRVDYPMIKGSDSILPIKRGEVLKVKPVFKYYTTLTFPLIEDFEKNTGFYLANANVNDTFCTSIDTANAGFGDKCLSIRLNATNTVCQVQSGSGFSLPNNGSPIYLECNYKGNFQLEAGVIGSASPGTVTSSDQRSAGGINASSTWKKMYINLTDVVCTPPYYNYYFLYFYTAKGFDGSVSAPQVYIDNVKVVRQ